MQKKVEHSTDVSHMNEPQSQRGAASIAGRVFRVFWKGFWSIMLIGLITGIIVGIAMLGYVLSLRDSRADINLKTFQQPQTSYVYEQDAEGNWAETTQLRGERNTKWVNLNQIPDNLKEAVIATEDKRFLEHHGVDWQRTAFAVVNLFLHKTDSKAGGSTITQQLIKNVTGNNEVSIERKLKEIFQALNLEKDYSKDEILEYYLNIIPLGNGAYGVQAAAETYFNKDVSELSLLECAAIAGITQNPSRYNPIYNPKNNTQRRQDVLYFMYEQGKITESQYNEIKNQELVLDTSSSTTSSATSVVDWYTDLVREDVIDDLMEQKGLSEQTATQVLYQGGLKIYSAKDKEMQAICEDAYITNAATLTKQYPNLQSGIFVMDYEGRVMATVGARGEKKGNRLFSYAVDAQRQPGSSIKPLSAYAPALEYGLLDWSTIVQDEPIDLPDGSKYPTNSYGSYRGDMTVQKALEISSNCAAVRTANLVGLERCFDFLHDNFHISTIYKKYVASNGKELTDLTLSSMGTGGTITGTTAREMAAAYATFGNGGMYYEPYSYYYVTDIDGKVILDNRNESGMQAISTATAGVMNQLLQAIVNGNEGTAKGARISGWQCFGKTGTTNDFKDRWFIAGNPYCVASVWVGYKTPAKISGIHWGVPIWKGIMQQYLANKPKKTFTMPDTIQQRYYCKESGGFATTGCTDVAVGWFKKDTCVTPCTVHEGTVIRPGQTWTPPESVADTSSEPEVTSSQNSNSSSPVASTPPSTSSSSSTSSAPPLVPSNPATSASDSSEESD